MPAEPSSDGNSSPCTEVAVSSGSIELFSILVQGQSPSCYPRRNAGSRPQSPRGLGCPGELFSASLWGFVRSSGNAVLSMSSVLPRVPPPRRAPAWRLQMSCVRAFGLHVLQGTGNQGAAAPARKTREQKLQFILMTGCVGFSALFLEELLV